jgi:hypothetical protein
MEKIKLDGFGINRAVYYNEKLLEIEPSLEVAKHSPTGFNWGYNGSGPAQLALAILLKNYSGGSPKPLSEYQNFKEKFISRLPDNNFSVEIDLAGYLKDEDRHKPDFKIDKYITHLDSNRNFEVVKPTKMNKVYTHPEAEDK